MDRLDGSYISGYTKALLDVQRFYENHSDSLKYCKLYNKKGIKQTLQMLIDNREELRETGDVEITYNTTDKKFQKLKEKLKYGSIT